MDATKAQLDAKAAQLVRDAAALAAREKEVIANEARLTADLDGAVKANEQAKSYEAAAYAKLEAMRKKLGEMESL